MTCDYLVTYFSGEPNNSDDADSTVFGRRVAGSICPDRAAPVIGGLNVTPKTISTGIKPPRSKGSAGASKKAPRKRTNARYTLNEAAAVVITVERKVPRQESGRQMPQAEEGGESRETAMRALGPDRQEADAGRLCRP